MYAAQLDVTRGISAAGTTQATATLLISGVSVLGTVASGSGVLLQTGGVGTTQIVYNGGANAVNVYPPIGLKINGIAANGPHILAPNTTCQYWTVTDSAGTTPQIVAILSA